jgi:hypothetical protein
MASGSYNNSSNTPAQHNAWSKELLSWLTVSELTSPGTVTMSNVEQNQLAYKFYTTTAGEYFLLENRQNIGFDEFIPGHGLLIYHVDSSYIASAGNCINCDPSHQGFDLEEADNSPIHGAEDPFPGSTEMVSFNDLTSPSSKSWANSNTNKRLAYIQEASQIISFYFISGPPSICNVARSPVSPTHTKSVRVTADIIDDGTITSAVLKLCFVRLNCPYTIFRHHDNRVCRKGKGCFPGSFIHCSPHAQSF